EALCRLCGVRVPPPVSSTVDGQSDLSAVVEACRSLSPEKAGRALQKILQQSPNHSVDLKLLKKFPLKEKRDSVLQAERTGAQYLKNLRRDGQVRVLAGGSPLVLLKARRGKTYWGWPFKLQALPPRMRADLCQAIGNSLL